MNHLGATEKFHITQLFSNIKINQESLQFLFVISMIENIQRDKLNSSNNFDFCNKIYVTDNNKTEPKNLL